MAAGVGLGAGRQGEPEEDWDDDDIGGGNEVIVGVSAAVGLGEEPFEPTLPDEARVIERNETINYVVVEFDPDAPEGAREEFIQTADQQEGVVYAEPNVPVFAHAEPNDPLFADQYALQMVNAPSAWDVTQGDREVTVAVLDSGVQHGHEDLASNVAETPGRDFSAGDDDPTVDEPEIDAHGTHVAGIIAATAQNNVGIAGMSDSTLIAGRVIGGGEGRSSDLAAGLVWAADQGADVVNLSLGSYVGLRTVKNAASYAYQSGALPIASAGNSGTSGVDFPAAFEECLAVSALDENGQLAPYSSYGDRVEIAAPGSNVLSTVPAESGSYQRISGTSMSAPMVSGAAALALSRWDLSPEELRLHLRGTATDLGMAADRQGAGNVDASSVVTTEPGGGETCTISTQSSVGDTLEAGTSHCWEYRWATEEPCRAVVTLDGPSETDFDLYVNAGRDVCPARADSDYGTATPGSQERVAVESPDTSTSLWISPEATTGSGTYELGITEYTLSQPADTGDLLFEG